MAKIRGGKVKSMAALKKSLKKGGGSGFIQSVPGDGDLMVRFLTEPNEWVEYFEHYDEDEKKFAPCTDDCMYCASGDDRPSQRYLANALDVAEGKVIALRLAKTLASNIMKKYERFKTLLDRDYSLSREGTGFDTEYDVIPEPETKLKLSKYEKLDLWAILEAQLDEDEDEEEEATPRKRTASKRTASKTVVKKKRAAPEPDDDDDDDDDDDAEEFAPKKRTVTKKAVAKRTVSKPKTIVKKKTAPAKKAVAKKRLLGR